ncbi:unnamed protein product [Staurois parvus]|uniref:Uncharacterized protein n=1 Tax=Staurois parvus TaxID=386267 RepID=A0ABN9AYC6_9NEOB|nr:unnamed protein product [Staurois parvus]
MPFLCSVCRIVSQETITPVWLFTSLATCPPEDLPSFLTRPCFAIRRCVTDNCVKMLLSSC